ncbi:serine/threonine protein kinase [Actinocorallia herbida]|uniref:Serine/threonine protein kinase n=1 Tax=Actinocorallia herbida TaxID=58109 RepID=A0A3N1CQH6_9ACTN|nr:serine/threonine-protein kinase [Actinocorallia herbida]ROO83566.1 serine/threonine protein kinase [Actinocorallia herbida]
MNASLRPEDPATVGPYRLTGRLGAGGMGTVFLGADGDGRPVAVKVINPDAAGDPQFQTRFRREVEAARLVRRFCTAPVLDASVESAPFYIVTEHVAGPTLEEAVGRNGALPGADLEALAVGTATALAAIHDAGLVHRDLKPSNVLLSAFGPRVIDFGIARALDSGGGVTRAGQLIGTPSYMAPEIVKGGEPSAASDVFSWGCVIAFAGTGRGPFEGGTMPEILYRIAHDPPRLTGLDRALLPLVSRALDKDPRRRPTTADLLAAFTGVPDSSANTIASIEAIPAPAPEAPAPPRGTAPAKRGVDGSPFVAVVPEEGDAPLIGPLPASPSTPPAPTVSPARAKDDEPTGPGAADPVRPDPVAASAESEVSLGGTVQARIGLRTGMVVGVVAGLLIVPLLAVLLWALTDGADADGGTTAPQAKSPLSVPEGFLGTWQGRVVRAGDKGAGQKLTITLTGGGLGDKVGTSEHAGPACTKDLTLTEADAVQILVLESGSGAGCAGAVPVTLSLTGSELVYGLNDGAATAVGTLTR